MNVETRRLYRSRSDRMIAGVAGGLGEYLNMDPTIVRLLFVVFALAGGPGLRPDRRPSPPPWRS
mgnify:CR=1 FL=1